MCYFVAWFIFNPKTRIPQYASFVNLVFKVFLNQFSNLPDTDQEEILMMVELKYNRTKKTQRTYSNIISLQDRKKNK